MRRWRLLFITGGITLFGIYCVLPSPIQAKTYLVNKGDTYDSIGSAFRLKPQVLRQLNNNKPLEPGMLLHLSAPPTKPNPMRIRQTNMRSTKKHVVQRGETLTLLSLRYRVPIQEICRSNPPLHRLSKLKVGDILFVPTVGRPKKVHKPLRLIFPMKGAITHSYGKMDAIMNYGIIFKPRVGRVLSCEEGRVHYTGILRGYGRTVVIRHRNDYTTTYSGLASIQVQENQVIPKGQMIGTVKGALFFSVLKNSTPVNPMKIASHTNL